MDYKDIIRLKKQVINEAYNLRKHATADEFRNLHLAWLKPFSSTSCIYGLMTGDCFSGRATELLQKCAVPFCKMLYDRSKKADAYILRRQKTFIGFRTPEWKKGRFSAIEFYVTMPDASRGKLIEFLKGRIADLTLEDL